MSVMWHLSMILDCYSVGGFELQSCGIGWKVFWRAGEDRLPFNRSQWLRDVETMRHICGISAWCQIKLDWLSLHLWVICLFSRSFFPLAALLRALGRSLWSHDAIYSEPDWPVPLGIQNFWRARLQEGHNSFQGMFSSSLTKVPVQNMVHLLVFLHQWLKQWCLIHYFSHYPLYCTLSPWLLQPNKACIIKEEVPGYCIALQMVKLLFVCFLFFYLFFFAGILHSLYRIIWILCNNV